MRNRVYSHAFDVAFEVETTRTIEKLGALEIVKAMQKRVDYLKNHLSELSEACSCFDTFEK